METMKRMLSTPREDRAGGEDRKQNLKLTLGK